MYNTDTRSTENLNMKTVSLKRITAIIRYQLEDEDYTPIVLLGKSGIGKTESVRDLAADLGIGFCELRLSHYQESDLIGLPYIGPDHKTEHAISSLLPDEKDEGQGILLLDEVTSAPKSMRSAVYQLLDVSRRLGEYHLPDKWLVIACGNGPEDGGDFRGIEPAFLSRGFCWRVEENLRVWKEWALNHDVHPAVIAYLSFRPEMLHVMDLDRPFDMIACPRNWTKLSTLLANAEKRSPLGFVEDSEYLDIIADGCVGVNCGASFAAFYQYNKLIIDPEDILYGNVPPEAMKELSEEAMYLTAQTLVRYMAEDLQTAESAETEDDTLVSRVGKIFDWIIGVGENVRLDTAITIIQDLTATTGDELRQLVLSESFDDVCPEFAEFALKNYIVL